MVLLALVLSYFILFYFILFFKNFIFLFIKKKDINECTGSNNCAVGTSTCTNTVGSYTCACNTGYTGSGFTCDGNDFSSFSFHFFKKKNKIKQILMSAQDQIIVQWEHQHVQILLEVILVLAKLVIQELVLLVLVMISFPSFFILLFFFFQMKPINK